MSTSRNILIILVILVVIGCTACAIAAYIVQSTQYKLLNLQQGVELADAVYGGSLDIVAQKITGTMSILDDYLDHESEIYQTLAEARKRFDEAAVGGSPVDQLAAAREFQLRIDALMEDNPEIASAPLAQQTSNALEEAVNEIFMAFQDWMDAIKDYNTYRRRLYAPSILGNWLGFPDSYEYYESEKIRFKDTVQLSCW